MHGSRNGSQGLHDSLNPASAAGSAGSLEVKTAPINNQGILDDAFPFGGCECSGLGIPLGRLWLTGFRRPMSVILSYRSVKQERRFPCPDDCFNAMGGRDRSRGANKPLLHLRLAAVQLSVRFTVELDGDPTQRPIGSVSIRMWPATVKPHPADLERAFVRSYSLPSMCHGPAWR